MYVCIIDNQNIVKVHENIKTNPNLFVVIIEPYREDIVVGVECVFC